MKKVIIRIFLTLLIILILSLIYYFASIKEDRELKSELNYEAKTEINFLFKNLNNRLNFIVNDLLDKSIPTNSIEHINGTKHLTASNKFIKSINFINSNSRIIFVSPFEENKMIIGLKIAIKEPKEAMEKALLTKKATLSEPFEIIQSKKGYSLMIALNNDSFFEVVFNIEDIFKGENTFFKSDKLSIEILDSSTVIFKTDDYQKNMKKYEKFKIEMKKNILNRNLKINIYPTDNIKTSSNIIYWQIVGIGAIIVIFLLFIAILILQTIYIKKQTLMQQELQNYQQALEKKLSMEIKERSFYENLLIQQTKMATMGEMIGAIAHQWKQPLNSLGLIIQDLEEAYEFNELNKEYFQKSIQDSMKQINFMSETINDFKNFFKPKTSLESFNTKKAIENVLLLLSAQLKNNYIDVDIKGDEFELIGNENEYKQVILNIINNAKDAILEKRKEKEIKGIIDIELKIENQKGFIYIRDNGNSIKENIIDKVFEPYFSTKGDKGTGIGLYLSKMLVEKLNGKIYLRNLKNNLGVKFIMEFSLKI